jgi:hypothetical protein
VPAVREQTHGEAYKCHYDRKPKKYRQLTGFFNAVERQFSHGHDLNQRCKAE